MITDSKGYGVHFVSICLLFMLGEAVIILPQNNADQFNFLAFLIAGLIAVLICFIPLNKFMVLLTSFVAVYLIGETFIVFIRFIKKNLLLKTQPFLIVLPFVLLVLFLARKSNIVLFKFSLISAIISFLIVFLFFFSTFKDFEFRNIFIYTLPTKNQFIKQFLPYLSNVILPAWMLSAFGNLQGFKRGIVVSGYLLGYATLGLTVLNSVLLFGIEFAGRLEYPYSSVGSTVTFGSLFTRLDGFIYFLYLSSCLVKCVVLTYIIKKSRRMLSP